MPDLKEYEAPQLGHLPTERRKQHSLQSNIAFVIGYGALFYLMALIFYPYLDSIVFGAILAGTFMPMHQYLKRRWKVPHRLAVVLVMLVIVCTFFAPMVYLALELTDEAVILFGEVKTNVTEETIEELFFGEGLLPKLLAQIFEVFNLKYNVSSLQSLILDWARNASSYLLDSINNWLGNLLGFLVNFMVMMVTLYGILAEGEAIKRFFVELSPLPADEEDLVIDKFNQMNYVTLVGNGIGGVIQGVAAGVIFWMAGIQSIFLWTATMIVLAFVPMVGMSVGFIPASLYLWMVGKQTEAVGVFLGCSLIAIAVEQGFKPRFVGGRVKIHSVLVFLSIIGGVTAFGALGIFYGPLVMSIFLTFVNLYHKRYGSENLKSQDQ
ncbi:MAG: hypothetical protein A2600_08390 [Candidatus Lambdaproteobacteria bacterium RIFOXYD1_FULL_56_27]|uniref:AI-2E family transporter n=1 Tax=Candidatus Lambdaproteobacteria bacterium RIFOXYD2_FULL_56_26 TaxID=1817773 RepID=A0A1F6H0H8_9PROT|nr:MAG: hypothetical protein A2426_06690 [Candidatus Lambdaproteobacteria bacterium RIFOXYC1_FULL_56_13]OGH03804.1 MAG: hypothetical protein A2557_13720 [Candidatus Lambdaproteobacteria bacterium RIFOXYD2_FULL_56_26]OGH08798.1 MAG: hypothetical protein A2600_08390 [Candidatus Lambdaproteobacteria bacterium RIFOXYD1_FULL_56_27]